MAEAKFTIAQFPNLLYGSLAKYRASLIILKIFKPDSEFGLLIAQLASNYLRKFVADRSRDKIIILKGF